jgi:hypothetical protein
MKKTKSSSKRVDKPTRQQPTRQEIFDALDAKQSNATKVVRYFGAIDTETAPAIDVVIMRQLNAALSSIDDELREACWLRGLLPDDLCEALRMATFLSLALPLARAAQIASGVPASILIAEAFNLTSGSLDCTQSQRFDIFNTGRSYSDLKEAFLQHAYFLSENSSFEAVIGAAQNPEQYLKEIGRWSKKEYGIELVATIKAHNLIECDSMRPAR